MALPTTSKNRSTVPSMNHDSPTQIPVSLEEQRLELGVLGRFFGGKDNAPLNIAGALAILLIGLLLAVTFFPVAGLTPAAVCSLLSLDLGYIFGKSHR